MSRHTLLCTDLVSQGGLFVARHALRYLLIVVVIAGGARVVLAQRERRAAAAGVPATTPTFGGVPTLLWVRYALLGLLLGGTWVLDAGEAPWLHAIRVAVLLLLVGPALRLARRRFGRHPGRTLPGGRVVHEWLVAKLVLVVVAVGVELLLGIWLSRQTAAEIVGLLLALSVFIGGPLLLERIVSRRRLEAMATVGDADDAVDDDQAL
jgi:uncharacterized membrane protein